MKRSLALLFFTFSPLTFYAMESNYTTPITKPRPKKNRSAQILASSLATSLSPGTLKAVLSLMQEAESEGASSHDDAIAILDVSSIKKQPNPGQFDDSTEAAGLDEESAKLQAVLETGGSYSPRNSQVAAWLEERKHSLDENGETDSNIFYSSSPCEDHAHLQEVLLNDQPKEADKGFEQEDESQYGYLDESAYPNDNEQDKPENGNGLEISSAEVFSTFKSSGRTALHGAVVEDDTETVQLLLETIAAEKKQAFLDTKDARGWTALHLASWLGHIEIAALLVTHNATVDSTCPLGNTPLHFASWKNHTQIALLLLCRGASHCAQNMHEATPLHFASYRGNGELVELILSENPDLSMTTKMGNTPLHCAAWRGHADIVSILIEAGGSTESVNKRNRTPYQCAVYKGHQTVISVLKNR